jgi:hypothetical protein
MSNSTSPSSVTVPTLAELAQQVRTSHAAVQAAGATVLHHVFSAGETLLEIQRRGVPVCIAAIETS